MTLEQRIRFALERSGLSARALSAKAGLSHGYLASVFLAFQKSAEPSFGTGSLRAVARAAGVSGHWLLTGKGSPDDPDEPEVEAPSTAPAFVIRPAFESLPEWPELLARAQALEPELPAWVWELLARTAPILTAPPTPVMVAELGRWMLRHESLMRSREPRKETGAQEATKKK